MKLSNLEVNIGFICSTYRSTLSTNHSLKLKNLNKLNLISKVKKNLEDFIKLLKLSEKLGCKIFRLGSEFIPFASHPRFNKLWLNEIGNLIIDYLPEIKRYKIRITMHPGQYVVLSNPSRKILQRSLDELKYHFWLLDKLELDRNSIVVIHGGGVYNNKKIAINNLVNNINNNSWLKERLALENDERNFNSEDILGICRNLEIPFVFDYFHHQIYPSNINIKEILETWRERIPEFHISSRGKSKYSHGNYIVKEDFLDFIKLINDIKLTKKRIDILLEAKKKELAVKKLLNSLIVDGNLDNLGNLNF